MYETAKKNNVALRVVDTRGTHHSFEPLLLHLPPRLAAKFVPQHFKTVFNIEM